MAVADIFPVAAPLKTKGDTIMTDVLETAKTYAEEAKTRMQGAMTEMSEKAKAAMDAGQLVANEIVIGIVEERLAQPDAQQGFILDGFPRNTAQAEVLEGILKRLGKDGISKAVHLHVDDEEIVKRLLLRAEKEGRADDKEDVIRHRIGVYNAETKPLLDFYGKQGKLVTVEGVGSLEDIFSRILGVL